jgi:hypothetical protein
MKYACGVPSSELAKRSKETFHSDKSGSTPALKSGVDKSSRKRLASASPWREKSMARTSVARSLSSEDVIKFDQLPSVRVE